MATVFSNVNLSHMNQKQLKKIAADVLVNPVTVIANSMSQTGKAALITAIKAK